MPYYFFNRCDEDKVPQIDDLASRLNLEECRCEPPNKEWHTINETNLFWLLRYNPEINREKPLLLQTKPQVTHRNDNRVLDVIKELFHITGSTAVYRPGGIPYNTNEFR